MKGNGTRVQRWALGLLVAVFCYLGYRLTSWSGASSSPDSSPGLASMVESRADPVVVPLNAPSNSAKQGDPIEETQPPVSESREKPTDAHPLKATSAAITARVVWARTGQPAVDHRVHLSGTQSLHPPSASTDENGLVAFTQLRAGFKSVTSERGGNVNVELRAGEHREVELVIPEGFVVKLRVEDEQGQALVGAVVLLGFRRGGGGGGTPVGITDQEGLCRLEDVAKGRPLWVMADGFEPSYRRTISGDSEFSIILTHPGFDFFGRVVDQRTGQAVEAAWVRVDGYRAPSTVVQVDGSSTMYLPAPPPDCRTDQAGLFRVPLSDRGNLSITVNAEGYAQRSLWIDPSAREERWIDVAIARAEPLFGYVVDTDGAPLGGAFLKLSDGAQGIEITAYCESDGSFMIPGVPAGQFTLEGVAAGGFKGAQAVTVIAGRGQPDLRLVLSAQEAFLFRVETPEGAPVSGCQLVRIMEPLVAPTFLTLHKIGLTDDKGECRVSQENLSTSVRLGITLPGIFPSFPFRTFTLEPGVMEATFELPSESLAGALYFDDAGVAGPGSQSAPRLTIFVKRADDGLWLGRLLPPGQSVSYEGLEAGAYYAVVALGNDTYELGDFVVKDGEEVHVPVDPAVCATLPPASL